MDGSDIGFIIGILICIVLSGFLVLRKQLYHLNVIRSKTAAENGDAKAAHMLRLANSYDKLPSTILVGNNIRTLRLPLWRRFYLQNIFPRQARRFRR